MASVSKHADVAQLITADIDNWVANVYFEIAMLPRYVAGEKVWGCTGSHT
jgi:hypothetical protein